VFKNSKSRDIKGLGDISVSDSIGRCNGEKNNQEAMIIECTENVCMVSQQKEMGPTTQSYKNEGCINDNLDEISAATPAMKKEVLQHKTRIKKSHEFTSSTEDSNMSVDNKIMTKYQTAKQIANLWKAEDSFIHVSW
jgi:hypothetical protein